MSTRKSNSRNVFTVEWMILATMSAAFALSIVTKLAAAPLMDVADTTASKLGALDVVGSSRIVLMQD
ncbi:hypothetical protein [Pseudoprimorskyibacter insulae]|uniref:Uncharacterized protein n=1 Tax=Pseudoprimorskyibacter insulae TaxID=1695997 RepID=A0A2R8AW18_9RHOB|nr:hypothetical protein [Pseudoprimorskyibacter insulae]SPF80117.1 hypothetical protein PRI8871_01919 [Pseudoprimorskyibacter insulae]